MCPKKTLFFLLVLFYFSMLSSGQYYSGSRYEAMGNCAIALSDAWSVTQNQAGMSNVPTVTTGIFHESRYLIKELSLNTAQATVPVQPGTIGFQYSYFGYSKFNNSKIGLAYARQVGKKVSAGIMIDYFNHFIITDEDRHHRVSIEGGIQVCPFENFTIGIHIANPITQNIKESNSLDLPTVVRFGMALHKTSVYTITAEMEKEMNISPLFKTGIEVPLIKSIWMRAGIISHPASFTTGLGYVWKNLNFDLSFSTHPILGMTPSFSLLYTFSTKK